ncbi:unnamed protein product [Paramecium primaurelia]|uniref:Transmembrane protein n=1 Tax=Paramecium primaurelia TaxID=5886 RepID=A0A8S1P0Q0_PARPR|nr:unnamed protein product [Paramecium primaurelia]
MNKAELFFNVILVQMVFSSIEVLNDQEQFRITEIQIEENQFEENTCIQIGLFSKYNPLGTILQIGRVGIFDSNCFHLFSITDKSTSSLNLIYYDCIEYELKQIKKTVEFISYDQFQISKFANIDIYKYENTWHYFSILQCADKLQIQIFEFGEQILLEFITNTKYPFSSTNIILTFGGGLIVSNSLIDSIQIGRKFSFFPGKFYLIDYSIIQFNPNINLLEYAFKNFQETSICKCIQNYPQTIDDVDIKWLQQEIFTISYVNCDSFIFAGWFRIQEVLQQDQEFTYHFLKLKPNFENSQLSNQNLSPLQFFYKISPLKNQIVITTYNYSFPSVNIDFSDNPFLITRIFDINNSIKLWHNIFVQLSQQQISVKLNFFEQNDIYPYDIYLDVFQFSNVQFKLYYGNLYQNSKNYLNIQIRNLVFLNCNDQFQQQNCHFSCETCDGPTSTDCLSCSESSKRLYISAFKSCICPYDMIDKNVNCLSYQDYNFEIKQEQNQQQQCQFGYFELDQKCIKCPSIINEKQLTCLECLHNPTSWYQISACSTILKLHIRNTAKTLRQQKIYYKYDGDSLQACLYCNQNSLQVEEEQYEELILLDNIFLSFCWKSFSQQVQQYNCYECPFDYCLVCKMLETGAVCLICESPFYLENGICTSMPPNTLQLNECLSPYYITSNKECKYCPIDKCKYCFEFYSDDLSKCTLFKDFDIFPLNEHLKTGCALCQDGYIFNFLTNLCEYSKPKAKNCLRAFINENSNEICILSSNDDFSVAPEIINCEKYIQNCLQCILTKYFVIKCTICKSGYTTTSLGGFCKQSLLENSKISVEGDISKQDGWVQLIQSFMMSFLPNQYYYRFGSTWQIQEMSIQCFDGYAKNPLGRCIKYCDLNCESCIFEYTNIQGERFECQTCPLNYYHQPIKVQIQGKCVKCTQLCQVCSYRSNEEIQIINPNFIVNDQNEIYLMKCNQQIFHPKIQLDPYLNIAKYCFDDICSGQLSIEIGSLFCWLCTWVVYENQIINYEYCNEMGVTTINLIRQYEKFNQEQNDYVNYFVDMTSHLKENIFSLQYLTLQLIGFDNKKMIISKDMYPFIYNFDSVEFHNLVFYLINSDVLRIFNYNSQVNLLFKNCIINSSQIINTVSIFQSSKYGELNFENVSLTNLNFINSSFLTLLSQNDIQTIKIKSLYLKNCSFINSNLFQFQLSKFTILIEDIDIDECQFKNSSIFIFTSNFIIDKMILFNQIIVKHTEFYQSSIINSTDDSSLRILYLNMKLNTIQESKVIIHMNNFSIFYVEVVSNKFIKSTLIVIEVIPSSLCKFNNILAQRNLFQQSNFLKLSSSSELNDLSVQLNNIHFEEINELNNSFGQSLLIKISCFKLLISDFQIINSNSLQVLQFTNVQEIIIQNLIYHNDQILSKIPISLDCVNQFNFQHQLLETIDCKFIKIVNARINNQQSSDQALLSFISNKQDLNIIQERIDLENFQIIGNLLSKQSLTNFLSIITIYSENSQQIILKDFTFESNFFHQHIDDPSETFASLIYIYSSKSEVDIINLFSSNNALTNSSSSFISINSKIVKFINYTVFNHNILNQTLWSKYYEIQFEFNEEQSQINSIIQQTFKFHNKGGACLIATSSFSCLNSSFTNILSQRSSLFEIKTQGQGNIILQDININSLNYDLLSMVDYSGSIYIYSLNSLLDLRINKINFQNIFNRRSSSIFTIYPSQKQNYISISNIQIINCISLINPIAKIEFMLDNSYQNKLFIQNVTILQNEDMWIDYIQRIGLLSLSEISEITTENSLINIKGGDLEIKNFQVEGIFITQLLSINSPTKLLIQNMQINQILTFYPLNLIVINLSQDVKSQVYFHTINFEKFKIYQIMNDNIRHQSKNINYSIKGCFIIKQIQIFDDSFKQDLSFDNLISKLQLNSQQSGSLIYLKSTSSMAYIYFTFIELLNNICNKFLQGLINVQIENNYKVFISELHCIGNYVEQFGCLNLKSETNLSSNIISISQSIFLNNNGTQGVAIKSSKVKLNLQQCLIMYNNANQAGGGLYLELSTKDFKLKQVSILHNMAKEGGGIYFVGNSNLNSLNFIQSSVHFNRAIQLANNIVESPTHLVLSINSLELISTSYIINDTQINSLLLKPYTILEQGKLILTPYLLIPSNQQVTKFSIYNPRTQTYQSYIQNIQILLKNSQNEMLPFIQDCSCQIEETLFFYNQTFIQGPLIAKNQQLSPELNSLDLSSLQFEFNPYEEEYSHFQININCLLEQSSKKLQYFLQAKSFKCQLGEFKVDNGCQKCQSSQGYYSVIYNATKCSIFDQKKFQNITSNSLQLQEGYWRPNYLSDQTEYCFKNQQYCKGGWDVGDNLCFLGHVGGLCEECDKYNIQGQGYYFKDEQSLTCLKCFQFKDSILPFILTSIWSLLSILMTLKSIDKTNILFTQLKIRQKFNKIIFKLDQDHESILLKMLLNYFWTFSVIFSFNIKFTFALSFIYQASNPSYFMANNLDCYLSQISEIELIYSRIITMIILMIFQLLIILIGFTIYALVFNRTFNRSMISATGLYLYVSNYAAIIKQFCSILSSRQISNINYIQGDVSLVFGYQNHYKWIYTFVVPGLGFFGCCIPFSLFFLMYIKKEELDNIKLRRHICYLFNEYNPNKYFWEQIKLTKKTIIIIIMTYFEINILLKASLLGLCLLFYQLLAVKNKPYIIQSLNNLDLQTGQICSIAIFMASAQYVCDQQEQVFFSILLQILIMLLCIKLCFPFVFDIVRVYIRKYRVLCVSLLLKLFQCIKVDFCFTIYLSQYKKQLIIKDQRLKLRFYKLKQFLLSISKAQIKQQKYITTLMSSQSSVRVKLNNSELDSRKPLKIELERLFETNN